MCIYDLGLWAVQNSYRFFSYCCLWKFHTHPSVAFQRCNFDQHASPERCSAPNPFCPRMCYEFFESTCAFVSLKCCTMWRGRQLLDSGTPRRDTIGQSTCQSFFFILLSVSTLPVLCNVCLRQNHYCRFHYVFFHYYYFLGALFQFDPLRNR